MKKLYDRICAAEAYVAAVFLHSDGRSDLSRRRAAHARHADQLVDRHRDRLFAWACFLCADIAWRKNSLMAIEVLTSRLPERLSFAFRMANYAMITAFLLYLIVMGVYLSWISRARSFQGIPEVSYSWVTLSLPVGATAAADHHRAEIPRRPRRQAAGKSGRGRVVAAPC